MLTKLARKYSKRWWAIALTRRGLPRRVLWPRAECPQLFATETGARRIKQVHFGTGHGARVIRIEIREV